MPHLTDMRKRILHFGLIAVLAFCVACSKSEHTTESEKEWYLALYNTSQETKTFELEIETLGSWIVSIPRSKETTRTDIFSSDYIPSYVLKLNLNEYQKVMLHWDAGSSTGINGDPVQGAGHRIAMLLGFHGRPISYLADQYAQPILNEWEKQNEVVSLQKFLMENAKQSVDSSREK
jgi:hypothetical protein